MSELLSNNHDQQNGEVAEWLKAPAWKACLRVTVTRVRIPLSPPKIEIFHLVFFNKYEFGHS